MALWFVVDFHAILFLVFSYLLHTFLENLQWVGKYMSMSAIVPNFLHYYKSFFSRFFTLNFFSARGLL
jgi:hypothetical protein